MGNEKIFDKDIKKASKLVDVARQLTATTLPMIRVTVYWVLLSLGMVFWLSSDQKIEEIYQITTAIWILLLIIWIMFEMKVPQIIFQSASAHLYLLKESWEAREKILNKKEASNGIYNIWESLTYQISVLSRDLNNYFLFVLIYTTLIGISRLQISNYYVLIIYLLLTIVYFDQFDWKKYDPKKMFSKLRWNLVKSTDVYFWWIIEYQINWIKEKFFFQEVWYLPLVWYHLSSFIWRIKKKTDCYIFRLFQDKR